MLRFMSDAAPPVEVPRLKTSRLLLREFRASDFEAYLESLPEIMLSRPLPDRRGAWRSFASATGLWMLNGAGWWLAEHRETESFAGMIGVFVREGFPDLEIGWSLVERFRGQGLAKEGAATALAWAFERRGAKRVIAHIDAENARSIRVAESIGLRYETDVDFYDMKTGRYAVVAP